MFPLSALDRMGPWRTIPNWLARLEATIWYEYSSGPMLITHARTLRERINLVEFGCSSELAYCLALITARHLLEKCCCPVPCPLDIDCPVLQKYTRISELLVKEYISLILIKTFHNDDLVAIRAKLKQLDMELRIQRLIDSSVKQPLP
jgi:hypothetical protein